jgi:hypothetical protein
MRLDQCLAVFITETQREDGTPATVEFYRYTVGKLVRYLESNYSNLALVDLSPHTPFEFAKEVPDKWM